MSITATDSTLETLTAADTHSFESQRIRSYPLDSATTWSPLVHECPAQGSRDVSTLERLVHDNAAQIHTEIARHGGVVFRGFAVESTADFERILSAIPGLLPITETFMCQAGRVLTPGSRYVFETDATTPTGGAFSFGFHSEHYFSPDVPAFHCFAALRAPRFAGETALVQTSRVYDELPDDLRQRLRQSPAVCAAWPLSKVALRYQIDEARLEEFCRHVGLHVGVIKGRRSVVLMKPVVCRHPITGEDCLQANFSVSLRDLDRELKRIFRTTTYAGPIWLLHRLVWKHDLFILSEAISAFFHYAQQGRVLHGLRHAAYIMVDELATRIGGIFGRPAPQADRPSTDTHRLVTGVTDEISSRYLPSLADSFRSGEETTLLARAIHKHMVRVRWQDGDILLLDNRQTLHSGMPGFLFPRRLNVIMCNPIPWEQGNSGYRELPDSAKCNETLVTRLGRFLETGAMT